jgi:hypothetical protein
VSASGWAALLLSGRINMHEFPLGSLKGNQSFKKIFLKLTSFEGVLEPFPGGLSAR